MSIPGPILLVIGLFISAHARLNAVIFGAPVSVSVLGLIALSVVLALVALALLIVRTLVRDARRSPGRPVYVITSLS